MVDCAVILVKQGGLTIFNKYFNIFLFLQRTMAEYLSYEETAAFIEATKWKGYQFLSSEVSTRT